jgi:hypothetical protein
MKGSGRDVHNMWREDNMWKRCINIMWKRCTQHVERCTQHVERRQHVDFVDNVYRK